MPDPIGRFRFPGEILAIVYRAISGNSYPQLKRHVFSILALSPYLVFSNVAADDLYGNFRCTYFYDGLGLIAFFAPALGLILGLVSLRGKKTFRAWVCFIGAAICSILLAWFFIDALLFSMNHNSGSDCSFREGKRFF